MNMEHWWNDTDRGKLKYWERNLFHCDCVDHKSHTDGPENEPRPPQSVRMNVYFEDD
jgi:hypothetical protein